MIGLESVETSELLMALKWGIFWSVRDTHTINKTSEKRDGNYADRLLFVPYVNRPNVLGEIGSRRDRIERVPIERAKTTASINKIDILSVRM